ncbi:MAG: urate oxidase [Leifsonia sp.]|nr:urate oxidase [Leifsonia sp.]|tara:strand:+ start:14251 stop:15168 length:918 start_codon:yes stop_codon:yes gene_type:complete
MAISLTNHQYGKAETHLVRIVRDTARHEIRDLNVSTALRGPFDEAYLTGDQSLVLPTDTQKNTAYAFAKKHGVASPEAYGVTLARHFVDDVAPVVGARVEIEEFTWQRAVIEGVEHTHTWTRTGPEVRTAAITVEPGEAGETVTHVIGGLKDFIILKSTGSEFHDFLVDEYTTLQPTTDRVMATSLTAKWRVDPAAVDSVDWEALYPGVKAVMIREFATLQSLALQQTLWHMGKAVLETFPELVEIHLVAPNKHHFVVDLAPFGLENNNEVFHADDRPYGLIEATIARDDAPDAGSSWRHSAGLA